MIEPHLTATPAAAPPDLRRLDATLASLRRVERDMAAMVSCLSQARSALAARPDDPEAARCVAVAELRMRGDAEALAHQFVALTQPDEATP